MLKNYIIRNKFIDWELGNIGLFFVKMPLVIEL